MHIRRHDDLQAGIQSTESVSRKVCCVVARDRLERATRVDVVVSGVTIYFRTDIVSSFESIPGR